MLNKILSEKMSATPLSKPDEHPVHAIPAEYNVGGSEYFRGNSEASTQHHPAKHLPLFTSAHWGSSLSRPEENNTVSKHALNSLTVPALSHGGLRQLQSNQLNNIKKDDLSAAYERVGSNERLEWAGGHNQGDDRAETGHYFGKGQSRQQDQEHG